MFPLHLFCREILPKKHLEYFKQWVYSFGYELIIQSTRLPLISGFYKLLSVVMKIVKKIKYFEVSFLLFFFYQLELFNMILLSVYFKIYVHN